MAKKSAARIKTIKAKEPEMHKPELPPIEETFDKMKETNIMLLETSVVLARRADNFANVRRFALELWGSDFCKDNADARMRYFRHLYELSIETYEKVLECARKFSLDEFSKPDMKDYFEDIIPKAEDILSERDLCDAELIFLIVKPWGEKMSAMHQQILDEIAMRKAMEAE